jgi:hypothetical protein
VDEQALQPLAAQPLVVTQRLDVRNAAELENVMRGNEAVALSLAGEPKARVRSKSSALVSEIHNLRGFPHP